MKPNVVRLEQAHCKPHLEATTQHGPSFIRFHTTQTRVTCHASAHLLPPSTDRDEATPPPPPANAAPPRSERLEWENRCSQPNLQGDDDVSCFTLSAFSWSFEDPFKSSHQFDSTSFVGNQYPNKEVEKAVPERQREFDKLLEEDFTEHSLKEFTLKPKVNHNGFNDWELVQDEDEFDVEDWVLPEKSNRIDNHGLVLKLNDIGGKVFGLSFNKHQSNVLACGGSSQKLKIYQLDDPIKSYELADVGSSSQTTFIDWHPWYPVAIASSCNAATAKIWDLRTKKPTHSFNQKNKHCSEIHWNPNHSMEFVVGSVGEDTTVKIWDLRNTYHALSAFGPKKGVVSLSWCLNPNLIITTNVDGGVDCWKLNATQAPDPSRNVYLPPECRSLPLGGKEEIAWFADNMIAASSPLNIGLYKLKSTG